MKSHRVTILALVVVSLLLSLFGCSEKASNPLRSNPIEAYEKGQHVNSEGINRMAPSEPPFIPRVVRSIKWNTPGGSYCGITYGDGLIWLGGSPCPWEPTCGHYYGVDFCPSEVKHFTYGQVGPIGFTWDGDYLCLCEGTCGSPTLNAEIFKITTDGEYVPGSYFTVPFRATGLAWDGQYLWAVDHFARNLKKLSSTGVIVDSLIPEIPGYYPLIGLAFDGNSFWTSTNETIYKISTKGEIMQSFSQPGQVVIDLAWCEECLLILDTSSGYSEIFVMQVSRCNCPVDIIISRNYEL